LLQIEIRVKNRDGQPVADLTREEFSLSENGEPQEIATFEYIGQGDHSARPRLGASEKRDKPSASESPVTTRIYIATDLAPPSPFCGTTWEYELFFRGVERFLKQRWRQGTEVSINGTAFTSDRDKLSETLTLMRRYPSGRSSSGKSDWVPPVISTHGLLQQGFECDSWTVPDQSPSDPYTAGERVVRTPPDLLRQLARMTLERYIDLTKKLRLVEGKKIVVLFARGFALGRENRTAWDRLAREALRSRVTFYSVIPTALLAPHSNLARGGGGPGMTRGLFAVAENTGGRAIHSTNDFSDVFQAVYDDNSNYYLLGYYPSDRAEEGRFRKISVSVRRPNLRVKSTKGYYEPRPFGDLSKSEKKTLLEYQALSERSYTDIPLKVGLEYFRDERKQPLLAFSVGISADRIPLTRTKKKLEVALRIADAAKDLARKEPALVTEQTIRIALDPAEFEKTQTDPLAIFQFPSRMKLSPGKYDWKVVVRDEQTGAAGSYRSTIDVPAFQEEISPSSLLLTTQRIEEGSGANGDGSAGKKGRSREPPGIDVETLRFYPQATNVFQRGGLIYVVYDVYNVPSEMLESPPGPRVFLFLRETLLDQPPFPGYQAFPAAERNDLSYVATLDTATLEPGDYNLVVRVPNSQNAISRKFTLVDR
jgi:VWFA-related protein